MPNPKDQIEMTDTKPDVKDINNPGGGDCAYFSIGIALIPELQNEIRENKPDILNKLRPYFEDENKFEKFKNDILFFQYDQQNKDLLNTFNKILRAIHVDAVNELFNDALKKTDPLERVTSISSIALMSDAMGVFNYLLGGSDNKPDAHKNSFFFYDKTKETIEKYIKELKEKFPISPLPSIGKNTEAQRKNDTIKKEIKRLEKNLEKKDKDDIEKKSIPRWEEDLEKAKNKKLLVVDTEELKKEEKEYNEKLAAHTKSIETRKKAILLCTFLNPDNVKKFLSPTEKKKNEEKTEDHSKNIDILLGKITIEKGSLFDLMLTYKKTPNTWGQENDASLIAEQLGQIIRYYKGKDAVAEDLRGEKDVLRLNNHNCFHWTTFIPVEYIKKNKTTNESRLYNKFGKTLELTRQEIINVLLDYTGENTVSRFWKQHTRHHRAFARDMITLCLDQRVETSNILRMIDEYSANNISKDNNGEFKRCIDYLKERSHTIQPEEQKSLDTSPKFLELQNGKYVEEE